MNKILGSIFREAWLNLLTNKARSIMTMLGIIWGIATVVVFLALAAGVEDGIIGALGEFGRDVIIVGPGTTSRAHGGQMPGKAIELDADDAAAIRSQARLPASLSVEMTEDNVYQYANHNLKAPVSGVEPEYGTLRSMRMASGRFLNSEDLREHRRVVVLGNDLETRLFQNRPAVGEDIRIGGLRFAVVGVLKEKETNSRFAGPDNRKGFIPFSTADQVMKRQKLSAIVFQPMSPALHSAAIKEVREILAERHRFLSADKKAIQVWDFMETVKLLQGMILGIKGINIFLGVLTLAIGGVGVMNVMLVAVTERTREIGIRKALGARRRQILVQFLIESLAITLSAGLIGILLGVGLCLLVPPVPMPMGQAVLDPNAGNIAVAFVILVAVGLFSGMLPAIKAAKLHPVEALRFE